MLDTLLDYVLRELRVIWGAPVAFVLCLSLSGTLIFFGVDYHYSDLIATQRERISLYQDKLKVGSPEQAEKQLNAMWNSLNSLSRRLAETEPSSSVARDDGNKLPNGDLPVWVRFAYGELGQTEIPGPKENPRIVEYFKSVGDANGLRDDVDDWASAFVEWSLNGVGITGPKSNDAGAWVTWGKKLDGPVPGCIVVFSFNGLKHVAFYIEDDGPDAIKTLGGNQSDAVKISRYAKKDVIAYRMPSAN